MVYVYWATQKTYDTLWQLTVEIMPILAKLQRAKIAIYQ